MRRACGTPGMSLPVEDLLPTLRIPFGKVRLVEIQYRVKTQAEPQHILLALGFGKIFEILYRKISGFAFNRSGGQVKGLPENHRKLFRALANLQAEFFGLLKGDEYRALVALNLRKHKQRQNVRAGIIPPGDNVVGKNALSEDPRLLPGFGHGLDLGDHQFGKMRRDFLENIRM